MAGELNAGFSGSLAIRYKRDTVRIITYTDIITSNPFDFTDFTVFTAHMKETIDGPIIAQPQVFVLAPATSGQLLFFFSEGELDTALPFFSGSIPNDISFIMEIRGLRTVPSNQTFYFGSVTQGVIKTDTITLA